MLDVSIIGIGQIPVSEYWDKSLRMIAAEAVLAALNDADLPKVDALYVGNAYGGTISSQTHLGSLIADYTGLTGIEAISIEAGDASGAAALRAGYLAVASGAVNTVLVLGVEKLTDKVSAERVLARNVSLDADYEVAHGATETALAALLMRRYMYEYNVDLSDFENFSINAHKNGKTNSNALFRNQLHKGAFKNAPMIADPISLFDQAPDADGAAAVVLTRAEHALDMVPQPIHIKASAVATDTFALQDRVDLLSFSAVEKSTRAAMQSARVNLSQISLFELHDSFTITATLSLEAAGFAKRGEGWHIASNNLIPISTFGGLKSRGNPAGATGIYQAVEACLQLRNHAGENQIANAHTALIQNLGGLATTAITHVLQLQQ